MSSGSSKELVLESLARRGIIRDNQRQAFQWMQTSVANQIGAPGQSLQTEAQDQSQRSHLSGVPIELTRNNVILEGGGHFQEGQDYTVHDSHRKSVVMTWKDGKFHFRNKLNPTQDNVVLEGGGHFKAGKIYNVRDRFGNTAEMVWQNGMLKAISKSTESHASSSGNNMDSSLRGHLLDSQGLLRQTVIMNNQGQVVQGVPSATPGQAHPTGTHTDPHRTQLSRQGLARGHLNSSSMQAFHQSTKRLDLIKLMKQVLEMGYKMELVKLVTKHLTKAGNVPDLNQFIDALEKIRKHQEIAVATKNSGATGISQGSTIVNSAGTSGASKMEDEYHKMKEQRQCKICMEKDVEITFVPCGHFATCEQCGKPLKTCPICRQTVKSFIKTFMS